jgi:DNA topoisomerase-1
MTQLEHLLSKGIRREGTPRTGFRYRTAEGKPAPLPIRKRAEELKLPPAWTDVAINPKPEARLQAVGRDKAGRWQYRYHPAFVARQEKQKYERLIHFAEALPRMRAAIARDMKQPGLGRTKVLACVLKILSTCFIRPGSQEYADENGHYGLATLRPKHVKVRGSTVIFDFPGKSGQPQHRELTDAAVARIVRQLLAIPGKEVFKYLDDEGGVHDVKREHINDYIKDVMGNDFSAKDFRTWAGTLICACCLARTGCCDGDSRTAVKKKIVAAVKETAEVLGNTPAVCRSSYVYPSILSDFEAGRVVEHSFEALEELISYRGWRLHKSEQALLKLLKAEVKQQAKVIPLRKRRSQTIRVERRAAAMRR